MNFSGFGTKGLKAKLFILGVIPVIALFFMIFFSSRTISALEGKLKFSYQIRARLIDQVGS